MPSTDDNSERSQTPPTSNPSFLARYQAWAGRESAVLDFPESMFAEADEAIERLTRARDEAREHTSTAAFMRLKAERDEWARKWHRVRAELAELKYPGMKGIVRPLSGEPASGHETTEGASKELLKATIAVDLERISALEKALNDLVFAARTSGGVAGRDETLCTACDHAEFVLAWASPEKAVETTEHVCEWTPIEEDSPVYTPSCPDGEEWQLDDGCELYPFCHWCGGKIVVRAIDNEPSEKAGESP